MKKLMLTFLLLALPATVLAEGQVVVIKKDCYKEDMQTGWTFFCKGAVKNIGTTDVKNVVISLTPGPDMMSYDEINYLPAKDKEDFKIVWRILPGHEAYIESLEIERDSEENKIAYEQRQLDIAEQLGRVSPFRATAKAEALKNRSIDNQLKFKYEELRLAKERAAYYEKLKDGLASAPELKITYQPVKK